MKQKDLIIYWIRQYGSIIPAKMSGEVYMGEMFGSETSKRCRELRKVGKLVSWKDGKFEMYALSPQMPVEPLPPAKLSTFETLHEDQMKLL